MLDERTLDIVKRIPLFKGLSDDHVKELTHAAMPKQYTRGQIVSQRGDEADRFFVILDGWVKLYRDMADGHQVVLHTFTAGESFAEAAILGQETYPASSEVVEDATMLVFSGNRFKAKLLENADLSMRMLASMSAHMRHLVNQMEQLNGRPTAQRLASFLVGLCDNANDNEAVSIRLPYDKTLVAARLGMQPETLSRAFGKLKKLGVESKGAGVMIGNPLMLAEFCEEAE